MTRPRIADADGLRLTAFATSTAEMPSAVLELRHRQRATAEGRILDGIAVSTTNTYGDTGQSVPVTVPAGLTADVVSGGTAPASCSGLTVPTYTVPGY
ncbi:hypothetical protein [Actinacidiphila sp. bgisy144]|uniref:hypothetical protein n=1 Tax=unclassified Actinacidiphila TaxID=2995708 RepID=UPI003EC0CB5B